MFKTKFMSYEIGAFIMHSGSGDICAQVVGRDDNRSDGSVDHIRVRYWHLGCSGRPVMLDYPVYTLQMGKKEMQNWVELEPEALILQRQLNSGPPKKWKNEDVV